MNIRKLFAATTALFLVPACVATTAPEPVDEGSYEEPGAGKADGLSADNWTYFSVRPDYRKCMWPMCGGYWVKRVNQPKTKCLDGKWADECYVAEIDWDALGLSEAEASEASAAAHGGLVVLRGVMAQGESTALQTPVQYAEFVADEGWRAATSNAASGIFYRAKDSGIVCITFPCPTVQGTRLNRNKKPTTNYAGLDLTKSGATQDQLDAAWAEMSTDGLVVAANLETVTGPAGKAQGLSATQFYTRIRAKGAACQKTGCSGQVCAPAGEAVYTTCEWLPEYGCLKEHGVCEPQPDGKCGWTPSAELDACIQATK